MLVYYNAISSLIIGGCVKISKLYLFYAKQCTYVRGVK